MDELMTAAEAARLLGVHRTHLHQMVVDGRLTGLKEPTRGTARPYRLRLMKSEVERLMQAGWRRRQARRPAPVGGEARG